MTTTLQPFEPFLPAYISQLVMLNKRFLVSQSYSRHVVAAGEIAILLTDYDDIGLANIHLAAINDDKYAAILYLQNPLHLEKLKSLLQTSSKYRVYWAVLKNKEAFAQHIKKYYAFKIQQYLLNNSEWNIARTARLTTTLQVIFGELFVTIKYKTDHLRIKFSEIENA